MKKNIKEDMERYIIHSDLIDDNTLIECVLDEKDQVFVYIRYVEGRTIVEQPLAYMSLVTYTDHFQEMFQMNENRDTLAIYKKMDDSFQLERLYDIKDHRFTSGEFLDLMYKRKFPNQPILKKVIN